MWGDPDPDPGGDPPIPQSSKELKDLKDQNEQQGVLIAQLKEMLRKEQTNVPQEKVDEYINTLSKAKAKKSTRLKKDESGSVEKSASSSKDVKKYEKVNLLKQQLEENKAKLAERGLRQKNIEDMVTVIKAQLNESPQLVSLASANVTSIEKKLEYNKSTSPEELYNILLVKEKKITDLSEKVQKKEANILDLQENLKEKDSVIEARTKAITLMTENLSKKGKDTLDALDETKEQMKKMQEHFIALEAEMKARQLLLLNDLKSKNIEITDLHEEIINLKQENENLKYSSDSEKNDNNNHDIIIRDLQQKLEDSKNIIDGNKTTMQEFKNKIIDLESKLNNSGGDNANIEIEKLKKQLDESNKNMIKMKAQNKSKIKDLNKKLDGFKKMSDANATIIQLQNEITKLNEKVAELEEEKGNMQLKMVESIESIKSSTYAEDIKELQEKLDKNAEELEEKDKIISLLESEIVALKSETTELNEKITGLSQFKNEQVTSEINSIQIEEQLDKLTTTNKELLNEIDELKLEKEKLLEKIDEFNKEKLELTTKLDNYIQENIELIDKLEKLSAEKVSSAESIEIVENLTQQEKLELAAYQKTMETNLEDPIKPQEEEQEPPIELNESVLQLTEETTELLKKIEMFNMERKEVMIKLEALREENNQLGLKLNEVENNRDILAETYEQVQTEKDELQKENEELVKKLKNLDGVTSLQDTENNDAVAKLKQLETDYYNILDENKNLKQTLKEFDTKISEKDNLETELNESKKKIAELDSKLIENIEELTNYQTIIEENKLEFINSSNIINQLQSQLSDREKEIQELNILINELNLQTSNSKLADYENMEKQLEELKTTFNTQIDELKEELEYNEIEIQKKNTEIDKLKQLNEQLTEKDKSVNKTIEEMKQKYLNLQSQLNTNSDSLNKQIQDLSNKNKEQLEKMKKIAANLKKKTQAYLELEEKYNEEKEKWEIEINKKETNTIELKSKSELLEKSEIRIQELSDIITNLQQQNRELLLETKERQEISLKQELSTSLHEEFDNLHGNNESTNEDKIKELQLIIETNEFELAHYKERSQMLEEDLSILLETKEKLLLKSSQLEEKLNKMNKTIEEKSILEEQMGNKLEEMGNNDDLLSKRIEELNKDNKELTDKVVHQDELIAKLKIKIKKLQEKILQTKNLQINLEELEQVNTELQQQLTQLKSIQKQTQIDYEDKLKQHQQDYDKIESDYQLQLEQLINNRNELTFDCEKLTEINKNQKDQQEELLLELNESKEKLINIENQFIESNKQVQILQTEIDNLQEKLLVVNVAKSTVDDVIIDAKDKVMNVNTKDTQTEPIQDKKNSQSLQNWFDTSIHQKQSDNWFDRTQKADETIQTNPQQYKIDSGLHTDDSTKQHQQQSDNWFDITQKALQQHADETIQSNLQQSKFDTGIHQEDCDNWFDGTHKSVPHHLDDSIQPNPQQHQTNTGFHQQHSDNWFDVTQKTVPQHADETIQSNPQQYKIDTGLHQKNSDNWFDGIRKSVPYHVDDCTKPNPQQHQTDSRLHQQHSDNCFDVTQKTVPQHADDTIQSNPQQYKIDTGLHQQDSDNWFDGIRKSVPHHVDDCTKPNPQQHQTDSGLHQQHSNNWFDVTQKADETIQSNPQQYKIDTGLHQQDSDNWFDGSQKDVPYYPQQHKVDTGLHREDSDNWFDGTHHVVDCTKPNSQQHQTDSGFHQTSPHHQHADEKIQSNLHQEHSDVNNPQHKDDKTHLGANQIIVTKEDLENKIKALEILLYNVDQEKEEVIRECSDMLNELTRLVYEKVQLQPNQPQPNLISDLESQIMSSNDINELNNPQILHQIEYEQTNPSLGPQLEEVIEKAPQPTKAYLTYQIGEENDDGWGWGPEEARLEEEHQNRSLKTEIDVLKQKLDTLQNEKEIHLEEIKQLQIKSTKLVKKYKEIKLKYDQLNTKSDTNFFDLDQTIQDELKLQIEQLESKIKELTIELNKEKQDRSTMQKKLDNLLITNQKLQEEKTIQDSEIYRWKRKYDDIQEKLDWGSNESQSPKKQPLESNEDIDELRKLLQDLTVDNEELQALLNDQKQQRIQFERSRSIGNDEKIKNLEEEILNKNTLINTINEDKNKLIKELEEKHKLIQELESDLKESKKEYQNLQNITSKTILDLQNELEEQKQQFENNKEIDSNINKKDVEIQELKKVLKDFEKAKYELESENKELKNDVNNKQKELDEMENKDVEIQELKKVLEDLEKAKYELESENKELKNNMNNKQKELDEMENKDVDIQKLKKVLEDLEKAKYELESENKELKKDVNNKQKELNEIESNINKKDVEIQELKTILEDLEKVKYELESENKELKNDVNNKQKELDEMENKLVETVSEMEEKWAAQVDERGNTVAESWKYHLSIVESDFAAIQKKLKDEIDELEERCNALVNENNELRKNVDTEIKNEVDRISALQQQINDRQHVINELKQHLLIEQNEKSILIQKISETQKIQQLLDDKEIELMSLKTLAETTRQQFNEKREVVEEIVKILERNTTFPLSCEKQDILNEIERQLGNNSEQNQKIIILNRELQKANNDIENLNIQLQNYNKLIQDKDIEISNIKDNYEKNLDEHKAIIEDNKREYDKTIDTLQNKIEEKDLHYNNLQQHYNELNNTLDDYKLKYEELNETIKNLIEEKNQQLIILQQKEEELKQYINLFEDYKCKCEELVKIHQNCIEEINLLNQQLQQSSDNKQTEKLENELLQTKQSLSDCQQQLFNITQDLATKTHDYETVLQQLSYSQQNSDILQEEINKLNNLLQQKDEEYSLALENIDKTRYQEFENHYEELLSAKDLDIQTLRAQVAESVYNTNENLRIKIELEDKVKELNDKIVELENKLLEQNNLSVEENKQINEMRGIIEEQVVKIEELKKDLFEKSNYYDSLIAELDLSRNAITQQPSGSRTDNPSAIADHTSPIPEDDLSEPVNRAELDLALYMLHQRDVRCEELTVELTQLLEERDTLQLRLSNAIREKEEIRHKFAGSTEVALTSSTDIQPGTPSRGSRSSEILLAASGTELASEASEKYTGDEDLANKLSELKKVGYRKDKTFIDEQEKRRFQQISIMEQHIREASKLPAEAAAKLVDATYTVSRDVQSPSKVLLNWLWGRSTPRVNDT